MTWQLFIEIVGALVIACEVVRTAVINRLEWYGHPLQFIGLAAGCASMLGGAVAILMRREYACALMIAGIAMFIAANRRTPMKR